MFDKDMQIRGKYATYWKALSQVPGNANETSKNFKVFESYIHVYMVAPLIGLMRGRKGYYEPNDESKDTAGMLAEVQIKNASKLKFIYRLIVLADDSMGLSDEEKINMAFREDSNLEVTKKGMELYTAYFFGGLEILYDEFVKQCTTEDDYVAQMYRFVNEYREKYQVDNLTIDIEQLLSK